MLLQRPPAIGAFRSTKTIRVVGIIGRQWSFFAPSSFAFDPRGWLIICKPDIVVVGVDFCCEKYPLQLDVFPQGSPERRK